MLYTPIYSHISTEPDLLLPIGLLLTLLALLFLTGVFLYREFKVELVLAFRTLCPFLYESTGRLHGRKPTPPTASSTSPTPWLLTTPSPFLFILTLV